MLGIYILSLVSKSSVPITFCLDYEASSPCHSNFLRSSNSFVAFRHRALYLPSWCFVKTHINWYY